MSPRDAAIRRVLYWTALLTGAALVGSQFGCAQPRSVPSSAGFPHAGRWPLQQEGPPTSGSKVELDRISWWIRPGDFEQPSTLALIQKANREGILLAGLAGPIQKALSPIDKTLPPSFVEPSE